MESSGSMYVYLRTITLSIGTYTTLYVQKRRATCFSILYITFRVAGEKVKVVDIS
jgi:hypothetical protein